MGEVGEETYFQVNSPQVVGEIIDHEAVIINLETGHYFSLEHVGADIWHEIERIASVDAIATAIANKYKIDKSEARQHVDALVDLLLSESLIRPADTPDASTQVELYPSDTPAQFILPQLKKYTDMEDLILLDPIHNVDTMGWPNVKQQDE